MRSKAPELVLASNSPRRRQILDMLGIPHSCRAPDFEEIVPPDMDVEQVPLHFAEQKALSLSKTDRERYFLGSDTVVVLENTLLGKPEDSREALSMLVRLNGKTHQVLTGVALAHRGEVVGSGVELTHVTFTNSPGEVLEHYAGCGEPLDKAGSYAIQGKGARLVESINGCFYNVMGLPVQLTFRLLKPFSLARLPDQA